MQCFSCSPESLVMPWCKHHIMKAGIFFVKRYQHQGRTLQRRHETFRGKLLCSNYLQARGLTSFACIAPLCMSTGKVLLFTLGSGSLTMASIKVAAWYLVCSGLYTGSSTIQKGCRALQSALASCCKHVRAASRNADALAWLLALLPLLLSLSLPVSLSEPD